MVSKMITSKKLLKQTKMDFKAGLTSISKLTSKPKFRPLTLFPPLNLAKYSAVILNHNKTNNILNQTFDNVLFKTEPNIKLTRQNTFYKKAITSKRQPNPNRFSHVLFSNMSILVNRDIAMRFYIRGFISEIVAYFYRLRGLALIKKVKV